MRPSQTTEISASWREVRLERLLHDEGQDRDHDQRREDLEQRRDHGPIAGHEPPRVDAADARTRWPRR